MECEYSKIYWEKANEKIHLFIDDDLKIVLEIGMDLCSVCPIEYKKHCLDTRRNLNDVMFKDDDCINSVVSNA